MLSHVASALATTYYVSAAGRDSNSGTSTTASFLTITKAANLTKPGDIVNVMNGSYGPFIISHSGSRSGGYITYRAYPGHHPTVLKNGSTWDGIQLWNSTAGPLLDIYAGLTSVTSLIWDYNILFNGIGTAPRGAHDLVVNPLFVPSPPFNFHLQTGSRAIGSGTSNSCTQV